MKFEQVIHIKNKLIKENVENVYFDFLSLLINGLKCILYLPFIFRLRLKFFTYQYL